MGSVAYFSHPWLGGADPDPNGAKWSLIRMLLTQARDGGLRADANPEEAATYGSMPSCDLEITPETFQQALSCGFVWVDYGCIPQDDLTSRALAIESLHS